MGANAQTAVPVFTAGQVLTAVQQTQINTGVPVFATTVTRDAAFGGTGKKTLAEGQFAYIEATNTTQYYDGAAWQSVASASAVAQVQSTTLTTTFSASVATGTQTAITGLSVSITPTSASNKVLIIAQVTGNTSDQSGMYCTLKRGATAVGVGTAAGSRQVVTSGNIGTGVNTAAGESLRGVSMAFLDSPATTSATTYSVDISHATGGTITVYVNRGNADGNSSYIARGISSITVLEVTP